MTLENVRDVLKHLHDQAQEELKGHDYPSPEETLARTVREKALWFLLIEPLFLDRAVARANRT
jgi:hypothetical protein